MINKIPIKVSKTKKRLNIVNRTRNWPISYCSKLLGVHFDTIRTNDIIQALNLSFIKLTLCISKKMQVIEVVKYKLDITVVLFLSMRKDKNIV